MTDRAPMMDLLGLSRQSRDELLGRMKRLLDPSRDARALYLDEKGELKPEAKRHFLALMREAGMLRPGFEPDPHRLYYNQGAAMIVLLQAMMANIDHSKLMMLQQELETER
jgi:hypothetical protein